MPMEMRVKVAVQRGLVVSVALLSWISVTCWAQAAKSQQSDEAFALEQQGKVQEAEAAWRAVIKAEPEDAEAYAHLGFLEARQEHYKEAVPLYRKALMLDPKIPGLRMNLGLAYFKGGELKEAIDTFDGLLKNTPASSPDALRLAALMGLAYYGDGQYAKSIPYLRQATLGDPQNLPFRLLLAHSCLWSKQYQCVMDVYHEILTLNAESAEADMLAGEALDEMKDHAGAMQQFRAAVKANPKEPNVHFGLGYLLWSQSQYEEAAQEFQAELDNVPNQPSALAYLADCNMQLGHPETARPLIEQAIKLEPKMELPHLDLGILDAGAGLRDDALREFKVAEGLSPEDVNVHWRMARLYQAMGRKDEAKVEFDKTSSLHKAANATIFEELDKARANGKPVGDSDAAPVNP